MKLLTLRMPMQARLHNHHFMVPLADRPSAASEWAHEHIPTALLKYCQYDKLTYIVSEWSHEQYHLLEYPNMMSLHT